MGIVLVSFTPLDAPGGVPRWNRDFILGVPEARHYSWWDVLPHVGGVDIPGVPEWDKARVLAQYLTWSGKVRADDIIVGDGFWTEGFLGATSPVRPENVISVCHGIWSHLTKEDVEAGKSPEFPEHHRVQVAHRRRVLDTGARLVAVSDFIADQMREQWGFSSVVINNGVDLDEWRPPLPDEQPKTPYIAHGATTLNKGSDHIDLLRRSVDVPVWSLDEAAQHFGVAKNVALRNATLVVQPSAYEGNSYFILESLASDVPVVAYRVGLLHSLSARLRSEGLNPCVGCTIDRRRRSPQETVKVAKFVLDSVLRDKSCYTPREAAELFSVDNFRRDWRNLIDAFSQGRRLPVHEAR